jgi:hypothetical protein
VLVVMKPLELSVTRISIVQSLIAVESAIDVRYVEPTCVIAVQVEVPLY